MFKLAGTTSNAKRAFSGIAMLGLAALGSGLMAAPAAAGNTGGFPQSYNPETAPGFTNTYSTKDTLAPKCPNALAGTPGSDPASKVLNQSLNTATNTKPGGAPGSFQPGGTVHYTYHDNPHPNGGNGNFTIQDCEVVFPAGFFQASDFNADGILIGNFSKADLDKGGTPIDGASLSGISDPSGNIYFSWTSHDVAAGQWVCNFARDIKNNHGGGGNRKATPTCYQVSASPPPVKIFTPFTPRVWVGYADDYRSTPPPPATTPTPWAGDPNVIFVGCQNTVPVTPGSTCPSEDTGAIRIDNINTGPSNTTADGAAIVVSNVSVTIGSCTFNPWPGLNQTVPAGKSLVLAQTGGFAGPVDCTHALDPFDAAYANFDTSERPGQQPGAKCYINDGLIPQISMKVDNTTTATSIDTSLPPGPLADTGQILNTGGTDSGACNGTNETHDWTKILG